MLYISQSPPEAITHLITSQQTTRVTLGTGISPGPVAKAIGEALRRAYPTVTFKTRYRAATNYISTSWVECTWSGPPNEAEATAVINVALRRLEVRP